MMKVELTILYWKYDPIKGHGVDPLMPILLNMEQLHNWKGKKVQFKPTLFT